jgi:kynurenine formamidase
MLGRTDPTELAAHLLRCKVVDLSHTLEEGIPAWPTHARFGLTIYEVYALGDVARHYGMTMSENTGTHMDAPLHFIQSGPAHWLRPDLLG